MAAVDVIGCLSSFVGPVEQAAIFRVTEKELSQPAAPSTNGDMKRGVPFLLPKRADI